MRRCWPGALLISVACSTAPVTPDAGPPPPPPTQCTIAGATYPADAINPDNPCQSCQLAATVTAWSSLAEGLSCGTGGAVCVSGACLAGCYIGATFYPPDTVASVGACLGCQPPASTAEWSPISSASGPGCDGGTDICVNGACQAGCLIGGMAIPPNGPNPNDPCQICSPILSREAWSAAAEGADCASGQLCFGGTCQAGCFVASTFYLPGELDPINACQSCQPMLSRTAFSPMTGLPQGEGCPAGQVCGGGQCADGCFIGGAFEVPGARNPGNNGICCSPTNAITSWTPAFFAQGSYSTGAGPMGVVAADFNQDHLQDLATVNRADGTVDVFYGLADGGFESPLTLTVGSGPVAIAAGDVNGDQLPDLVVANSDDQTVSVLINAGAGLGFAPQVTYGTLGYPSALVIADLDGTHGPDLAVTNLDQGTVAVLLNAGGGLFDDATPYSVGNFPTAIVAGDLNGDGFIDLAVANSNDNEVAILLNPGTASFDQVATYAVGAAPQALAIADFNADGSLDLVVSNASDDDLGVLLNDGTGAFPPQVTYSLGAAAYSLTIADFNNDTLPDIAAADYGGGQAAVLLNQGGGAFASAFLAPVGPAYSSYALAAADFNGDLVPDLAVVGADNSTLQILINQCP